MLLVGFHAIQKLVVSKTSTVFVAGVLPDGWVSCI